MKKKNNEKIVWKKWEGEKIWEHTNKNPVWKALIERNAQSMEHYAAVRKTMTQYKALQKEATPKPKYTPRQQRIRERNKQAGESFNWARVVTKGVDGALSDFLEHTHMRTLKKMLKNNIREAQLGGMSKRAATIAKNKIDKYKGSKTQLFNYVNRLYGDRIAQNTSDIQKRGSKKSGIVKTSKKFTKAGKVRKRYQGPILKRRTPSAVLKRFRGEKLKNYEKAAYRLFKTKGGWDFDSEGRGVVNSYFFDAIAQFAALKGAGLSDLQEWLIKTESIDELGVSNETGYTDYGVELTKEGLEILKKFRHYKRRHVYDDMYGGDIVDIRGKFGSDKY